MKIENLLNRTYVGFGTPMEKVEYILPFHLGDVASATQAVLQQVANGTYGPKATNELKSLSRMAELYQGQDLGIQFPKKVYRSVEVGTTFILNGGNTVSTKREKVEKIRREQKNLRIRDREARKEVKKISRRATREAQLKVLQMEQERAEGRNAQAKVESQEHILQVKRREASQKGMRTKRMRSRNRAAYARELQERVRRDHEAALRVQERLNKQRKVVMSTNLSPEELTLLWVLKEERRDLLRARRWTKSSRGIQSLEKEIRAIESRIQDVEEGTKVEVLPTITEAPQPRRRVVKDLRIRIKEVS